ncbi:hypothetical protein Tco_1245479 [Tanacetum coccineum]
MNECVSMSTPMTTENLVADLQGTPTDQMTYRRMIRGLMYLTASRPDITFVTFVCARYQARPTVKHLKEVKRIFRYLRQSYNMGLWYPKDYRFELIAYSDADHAGCKDDSEYVSLSDAYTTTGLWIQVKQNTDGTVELYFVGTEYQLADLFTKGLPKERFEYLVHRIDESRILANILQNHPLRSVLPLLHQCHGYIWGSFGILATNNNHDHFVPALKFSEMVPFYIKNLGFTLELRSTSNFKTTGLLQPWQTLCKMFSRCLTTRVTGYDQPSNPTTMIPYPRFTKLIVSHYMTAFPEISRRVRDRYHNLEDDVMIKIIFNSGKSKTVVGMKISDWMITDEMKLTENYWLYAEVFRVDVPTTQSQPIESTQGTLRTTSTPRTPNPEIAEGESSAPRRSTVIRLRIPPRRST